MTTDNVLAFSPATVAAVIAEAQALNLKGATAITVALRNQLAEMKASGKVPDLRSQEYFVAGRVVSHGMSEPLGGVADITGLAAIDGLGDDVSAEYFVMKSRGLWEPQLKSARVNLSRKGEAHLQVCTERNDSGDALSWVDLYVFQDAGRAAAFASQLPTGKVF